MKKIFFTIIIVVVAFPLVAQNLMDIYKKGTVKLVPDTEYANSNDWNQVFKTYYDTIYGTPMGNRKSLEIMPDGSVVVNHAYRDYYTKFSPNGRFEKEFGIRKANGTLYKKTNSIEGIINNNIFYTGLDNMGNMLCFDFNGNYIKTLKLDYRSRQMIPLSNNKIAVVGWVIWSTKIRDFVAIVDYETNKEKIIWDYFTERPDYSGERNIFNYTYEFKSGGMIGCSTMPFSKNLGMESPPIIQCTGDRLIVSNPIDGIISIYDLEGNLKSTDKIEWAKDYISVEEQKEIQQKAIEDYTSMLNQMLNQDIPAEAPPEALEMLEERKTAVRSMLKEMETDLDRIDDPIPLPVFSTILKDSDENLLFFEYSQEENTNQFNVWVYENGGEFVCQSSFVCDDYNLEINPSKMVFHDGYIYGLQLLKNASGVPLRLVRFTLANE